ncbi:MAG: trypsin-like peptidase domain-containing protein [Actinomycetota bacterium]|nr:trypsin-like peptidase domain-containing protein [Actinomycetota bacterium]
MAAALVVLAGAGCSDDDEGAGAGSDASKEVRTTRVEVVSGLGKKGSFDPAALYERLSPGVVTVLSVFEGEGESLLRGGEDDEEGGQGSGFVLDGDGHVATNAHVVTSGDPPDAKRAEEVYVELSDGNRVRARILGDDPNADVALLKIDPAGLRLTPLRLGRSRDITVGEPVAAIGSPFGERQSLSVGVVSALDRTIRSLTAFQIGNAIQTDAAINPGNSGGPLLSGAGRVLGINSQIKSASGGGEGVGFAVPADTVRRSLRSLRSKGRVDYGYLGVTSQPLYPQLAARLGLRGAAGGALIVEVEEGSPADEAGLGAGGRKIDFQGQQDIPEDGDVVVAVDGRRLTRTIDLADLISAHDAGDRVEVEVVRDGKRREVTVKLAERPERAPSPGRP